MNNGISFMVRVRDEESTLEESIRSLFNLTINYEIAIILHLCTDRSSDIANALAAENSNVKVFVYNTEISRPGFETLATDANSEHSLITYYKWCKSKLTYSWVFKWDADFLPNENLLAFLNANNWVPEQKHYYIDCISTETGKVVVNKECYLIGDLLTYAKYIFWEVPIFCTKNRIDLDNTIYITHLSKVENIKSFWHISPWYLKENTDEAMIIRDRIERLEKDYGSEILGGARSFFKDEKQSKIFQSIKHNPPSYISLS